MSPTTSPSPFLQCIASIGLGYGIAISIGVLVLLSSLLLATYICLCSQNPNPNPNVVTVPRIIFVAEDGGDDGYEVSGGPVTGLDPAAIDSYPKFPYASAKGGESACSICLCEYGEGEAMRMMPECRHYIHSTCVDAWLRLNASCPVCRTSPMPTPLSTPLSELMPLSQYSDNQRGR